MQSDQLSIFQKHENFSFRALQDRVEKITESKTERIDQENNELKDSEGSKNTESTKSILIATSVTPSRIETQITAIDTWLKLGFKVVSLNTKEEADRLQHHFPNMQFHIVERSAKERYGKPYVYIYDFMRYLDSTDYNIVGIVNSDIHFKGVQDDFLDFICQEAADSLVYGHRLDVKNLNDSYGTLRNGVDYFFFDKNVISIYPDDGLCIGQPAWDWWMVCVAASKNIPTKRVLSKIALHQIHPKEWYESLNQYLIESIVFKNYLQKLYPDATKDELNSKMWDIVISKSGIEYKMEDAEYALEDDSNAGLETQNKETEIPVISNRENLKPILVATSIGPDRIETQKRAIQSWLYAGFDVVSLNTKEEADNLQSYFPDIEFHVVERSAKEKYGKPYIYIYDFMRYLDSTDYDVVGIINSDIQFKDVKQDFVNGIYEEALDSLVYGHRIDVNHISDSHGTLSNGVDYFFFDKNLISIYPDDGLCMGQPAWDWWMVCVPASINKTTKRLLNPIGYHEIHPQQWDQGLNNYLIDSIVMGKYLRKLYPDASYYELNSKMWDIVISKSGIEIR
ncbi:hypothetical protein [Sporolactobacillus putidus]|uniref:Uncharacterized protein n=1 Tax=Sporolactobacillus putidus TaxID=492735 RepID=A0A917RZR3_9BACL|nr:hypothetical protein [Sporolactobacillus putidus]GGL48496.1 hypothetical protein GCM10007968_10890 [Sporolactobacillus putidus]